MSAEMRDYRAFIIERDGRIRDRFEFWAEDDQKTEEHAKQYVDGYDVELWHQAEKIAVFKSKL